MLRSEELQLGPKVAVSAFSALFAGIELLWCRFLASDTRGLSRHLVEPIQSNPALKSITDCLPVGWARLLFPSTASSSRILVLLYLLAFTFLQTSDYHLTSDSL